MDRPKIITHGKITMTPLDWRGERKPDLTDFNIILETGDTERLIALKMLAARKDNSIKEWSLETFATVFLSRAIQSKYPGRPDYDMDGNIIP